MAVGGSLPVGFLGRVGVAVGGSLPVGFPRAGRRGRWPAPAGRSPRAGRRGRRRVPAGRSPRAGTRGRRRVPAGRSPRAGTRGRWPVPVRVGPHPAVVRHLVQTCPPVRTRLARRVCRDGPESARVGPRGPTGHRLDTARRGTALPGAGPARSAGLRTDRPGTSEAGTGPPGGGNPPCCAETPGPGGLQYPAALRACPDRRVRRVRPGRRVHPIRRVRPGRRALAGTFPAGPAVPPAIRALPSQVAGPAGRFRERRGNRPARVPAADGGPGMGLAVAGRPEGRPTPYPTSAGPARRPGAGPRRGAGRWAARPGHDCPGRDCPSTPGRDGPGRDGPGHSHSGLAARLSRLGGAASAAGGAGAVDRPIPRAARRSHRPVPAPGPRGPPGVHSGGAQDGRQPGTSRGRVRRHHVPPGTSWRLRIRRARPLRHSILKKSLGRAECPIVRNAHCTFCGELGLLCDVWSLAAFLCCGREFPLPTGPSSVRRVTSAVLSRRSYPQIEA